jgi:hypothetical protein
MIRMLQNNLIEAYRIFAQKIKEVSSLDLDDLDDFDL